LNNIAHHNAATCETKFADVIQCQSAESHISCCLTQTSYNTRKD